MMADNEIRKAMALGHIKFLPTPEDSAFQPASVDVRLGRKFMLMEGLGAAGYINPLNLPDDIYKHIEYDEDDDRVFLLRPGEFVLAQLLERLELGRQVACRIEGKSSLGRLGVGVHVTAGFVDPGWKGHLTIELVNFGRSTIELTPGMSIAQLAFDWLKYPVDRPYGDKSIGSRYQDAEGTEGSEGV